MKSIIAGVAIGLGGIAFLSTQNPLYFAIGLVIVCSFGAELYTGQICYPDHPLNLLRIFVGNSIGAALVALAAQQTRFSATLQAAAQNVMIPKLTDHFISLIILGVLCNFLIFVAVHIFKKNLKYADTSRYLGIILAIMVFVACGFEHCIADVFYLVMAGSPLSYYVVLIPVVIGNTIGGLICRFLVTKKYL